MALWIAEDSKRLPLCPGFSHTLGAPAPKHFSVPPLGSFQFVGISSQVSPRLEPALQMQSHKSQIEEAAD